MNSPSSSRDNTPVGHEAPPGVAEVAWTTHVSLDTDLLERLVLRHRERQRRYHRIEHVEAVLGHIDELATHESIDDLSVVVAAALYHDAIYESQHPANERASARLARRDLMALGWDTSRATLVGTMIEGTKTHVDPPDTGTAVLFDADLAILGADDVGYQRYASKIRDEYGHLDNAEWTAGRTSVLTAFLERQTIYATATGRAQWEEAARVNITAELAELTV
ncbi:MAG: metal-dependent phosphohydrolase [Ilumatobacter sp.]|uniref:HD domain-containing protein n=1 Tax=Ilumatobacter sp. TaxID=1967498 RepID=UPI001DB77327|nr:metal-dependent phosphohydrolase [Ilumatobacter sp.]MBT5275312.1 metal-dependent phosphohydrolase [Ilumatobacter sp.]MBT5553149.1 metal-dependent phosphohydrolase [Ilumatobacter sp.]MBT5866953.1 metal-dependent phosphohydrolase [Ilumatobacter sp.]MDG0975858.1 hypothetical protein [Ilumatobacter sp.]